MKILVTGCRGQVGSLLTALLASSPHQLFAFDHSQLDITDQDMVSSTVAQCQPDVIINAAAYTAVDKAQTEPDLAYRINEQGVAILAQAAEQAQAAMLHLSTDYVFSGEKEHPYNEADAPAPVNVYGASKLAGEIALARYCRRYIILRTSWVFSESGRNFVKSILRLARDKHSLDIVADQKGGPTYAGDIAQVLLALTEQLSDIKADNWCPWGIYHYSGEPYTNWADFAGYFIDLANKNGLIEQKPVINKITSGQFFTLADRPANSCLDNQKIRKTFGIAPSNWQNALKQNIEAYC